MNERDRKPKKHEAAANLRVDEASADSFPASDPPAVGPQGSMAPPPEPPPANLAPPPRLPGLPPPVAPQEPHGAPSDLTAPPPGGDASADAQHTEENGGVGLASNRWRVNAATIARIQGGYFLAAGAWPLLHMRSFEWATGGKRKSERWLVKTVGVLAASIGTALITSARQRARPEQAISVLGATSALGFLAIDLWYVSQRKISPIYLVDATVEGALALGWLKAGS